MYRKIYLTFYIYVLLHKGFYKSKILNLFKMSNLAFNYGLKSSPNSFY